MSLRIKLTYEREKGRERKRTTLQYSQATVRKVKYY